MLVENVDSPVMSAEDLHHLGSVLRLRPGESVSVTDGRGSWRLVSWTGGATLAVSGEVVRVPRPAPSVCVAFAPVKGDRNEWAVQKLAELGVDRVVLLRSERSVIKWDARRTAAHLEKMRKVARQAIMQSRGLWLPQVDGVVEFDSVVADGGAVVADPAGRSGLTDSARTVLVGPEGGWSEKEISSGEGRLVRLSEGVLRTESAAVAAGVLLTSLRAGLVSPAKKGDLS